MPINASRTDANAGFWTKYVWSGVSTADSGEALTVDNLAVEMYFNATGTFGGATVGLEGSVDGVNWFTITDAADATIAMTAAGVVEFKKQPLYLRPTITGGTGDSLQIMVFIRWVR